ncbi:MAG: hypothetical protein DRP09_16700 [Candidatus Thorarchaeota archaeon]|nr:MAG: hypothetical protein DRP09_16700 [Candidatus Thorarchaeota archaeon]
MIEYNWRPGHDQQKPKKLKPGDRVLFDNKFYIVSMVDRHSYPVVLKGLGRVREEDCELHCHSVI